MINIELEQEIIQYVKNKKSVINWNNLPIEYELYLKQRYTDNVSNLIKEPYLRILYNIEIIPKCPICNNSVKFMNINRYPYSLTCKSKDCMCELRKQKSDVTKELRYGDRKYNNHEQAKRTKLERYGDEHYTNLEKTKQTKLERYGDEYYTNIEKGKQTCLERYGTTNAGGIEDSLNKIKATCLERYGVTSSWQIEGVSEKCKKTKLERYGDEYYTNPEKTKQTCLEKYGTTNVFKVKYIQDKYKKTCLERYGVDHNWKIKEEHILTHTKEAWDKRRKTCLYKYGVEYPSQSIIIKDKVYNTKSNNHTHNTSIPENESYILLLEKFKDVKYQYKNELYPFNCDFYIPNLDLYIECNYHWTHGLHPFNGNDINDIDKLNKWKKKNTKYFNSAIKTWTERDILKRETAKNNNLNFIEFWNIDELKKWLLNY